MTDRALVSIVAPVYNEEATLREFLGRTVEAVRSLSERYDFEFILVDDGSTDESIELAKSLIDGEPRLRVIELRRNFGQTAALQAGLEAAKGEIVVSMDSDLQHFPEDIPDLLAPIEEGFDLACGWRYQRQEGVLRRWPSRVANRVLRAVSGVNIHDFGTTFRAYRADLVHQIKLLGEQHRFVPALAAMVGARIAEVKIQNVARPAGKSNYGLGRTFGVLMDIVFLHFSIRYLSRPLRAFGKIAFVLMLVATGIGIWLLAYAYTTGISAVRERSGWFFLAIVLALSALQLMLTGILAEILVRVYYRSSGSEGYVVRREWTSRGNGQVA